MNRRRLAGVTIGLVLAGCARTPKFQPHPPVISESSPQSAPTPLPPPPSTAVRPPSVPAIVTPPIEPPISPNVIGGHEPAIFGEVPGAVPPATTVPVLAGLPAIPERFRLGEQLRYTFYWFGIPVIRGEMHVQDDVVMLGGRPYSVVVAGIQSTGLVRRLFVVDDETATQVDLQTLLPIRHQTVFHHRSKIVTEDIVFDRVRGTAFSPTWNTKAIPIDPRSARGPLGACYYFRTLEFHDHQPIETQVVANGMPWDVRATVVRRGSLTIAQGTFPTLEVRVDAQWLRQYLKHSATLWIWVSDDPYHVPLMAKVKLPFVGSLTAVLTDCAPHWPTPVAESPSTPAQSTP